MANNQQLLLGEGAGGGIPNYIEEVFSTYLYTGNASTQTVTNNIDLSTKGGLVWTKCRSTAGNAHFLFDTTQGLTKALSTSQTAAAGTIAGGSVSVSSTGYALSGDLYISGTSANSSALTYVSWTFREQPKFFDVVTYTGTGSNTTIAHALGVVPGCIIVKRTDTTADWAVYHRSLANTQYLVLNTTAAAATGATWWNSTTPTSSVFSVGTDASVNASGGTYVAYIYAHDAGGFGLAGTDNVISCGTFTGNTTVTLGYEPQWILLKRTSGVERWYIIDTMRGWPVSGDANYLAPNTSDAENQTNQIYPNATGFSTLTGGGDFIYVAIRRGPMKVPTVGTSVFTPIARTGTGAVATVSGAGFAPDLLLVGDRNGATGVNGFDGDKLRGATAFLHTYRTNAEATDAAALTGFTNDGVTFGADGTAGSVNYSGTTYVNWLFQRAPSFFDEVCVTTSGYAVTATHNLGVSPELIIGKARNQTGSWFVWVSSVAALNVNNLLKLNTTDAATNYGMPINTVTATSFYAAIAGVAVETEVFYLFATCAGVSKVGTYTGNGSSQTIACGFAAGSRFVMIKRTDSTGDWYVWDSARGIVAGNDPHLSLNTTAAEVTSDDSVDTDNSGFIVNQVSATNVNVTSATYIFLAIA